MKAPLTRIKEETKKRTENSKHYFNNNGSYTAEIFGGPIHYKDRNNQWQDIDTTVVISDDPNYDFMNITNSTKTYFKKEISGTTENVKIIKDNSTILIKSAINLKLLDSSSIKTQELLNKAVPQKNELNKIKFSSVYKNSTKNIDIDYHIFSNKLHEEFIVNEPMEFPEISQEITLINAYFKQENKSILIYNSTTNKIIGILPPPVMFEQNNPLNVSYDLYYKIVNLTKDTFVITKVLDAEGKNWFFSLERNYPLIIDTNFTGSTNDGYIYGYNASYNTARSTAFTFSTNGLILDLGQGIPGGQYEVSRGFLKFDTSSIGVKSTVLQVNLRMAVKNDFSTTDSDVQIVKLDWSNEDPITSDNKETAFDNCLTSDLDDNIWRNTSGISTDTNYTSNNLSISWINKSGNTYYGLRSSQDTNNITPTTNERVFLYAQEDDPSYVPLLIIIYTTPIPEQLIIIDNY